ncbi:hypothetical protein J5N97_019323 [Dioscorea zingiberensis]|uniref:Uncharacterized protein n=1 Tax=Dioscorea zingiberensis TaxID=325984 RepID=A0A9D5CEE3_9LILI|nr:hypothetical protein J5N97_019323 [Dioscorea zingiberensis]
MFSEGKPMGAGTVGLLPAVAFAYVTPSRRGLFLPPESAVTIVDTTALVVVDLKRQEVLTRSFVLQREVSYGVKTNGGFEGYPCGWHSCICQGGWGSEGCRKCQSGCCCSCRDSSCNCHCFRNKSRKKYFPKENSRTKVMKERAGIINTSKYGRCRDTDHFHVNLTTFMLILLLYLIA